MNPSHHKIPTQLEYTSTFTNICQQFIPEIKHFKTMNKPDLLILNTKLYCLSKSFYLPSIGITSVFVKQNWCPSLSLCIYLHHQWSFLVLFLQCFSSGILYRYIISIHYKEQRSSLCNIYSVAFIGPCNALGVGELEETIRPCSFTIGSETKSVSVIKLL